MSRRANHAVRQHLAERLRLLRKERHLSQERLGELAGLSGKFVGEVERSEKSISVDSLYHVARALGVRLPDVVGLGSRTQRLHPTAAKIMAFVEQHHNGAELRRAYDVLRALFKSEPRSRAVRPPDSARDKNAESSGAFRRAEGRRGRDG